MSSKWKAQEQLDTQLQQQSIETTAPTLNLAWKVFKEFIQVPLPYWTTIGIGISILHVCDRDNVLWLEFIHQIEDAHGSNTNIGCQFSCEVPPELERINKSLWWRPEHSDLPAYFAEIEAMPEFQACLSLDGWKWESSAE